jgi:hypothetical protein
MCLLLSVNDFLLFYEIDNVGRERLGRRIVAHSSARRERAAEAHIPRHSKGKKGVESSSQTQHEPEYAPAYEPEYEVENEAEKVEKVSPQPRTRKNPRNRWKMLPV